MDEGNHDSRLIRFCGVGGAGTGDIGVHIHAPRELLYASMPENFTSPRSISGVFKDT